MWLASAVVIKWCDRAHLKWHCVVEFRVERRTLPLYVLYFSYGRRQGTERNRAPFGELCRILAVVGPWFRFLTLIRSVLLLPFLVSSLYVLTRVLGVVRVSTRLETDSTLGYY